MDMLAPDDGQFRMGGMLHASYSSSSGSAPPPHPKRFEELRAAVERFYPGDFLTLLMQPRPIYIVEYVRARSLTTVLASKGGGI